MTLYHWCQWISEFYPNDVYQGENETARQFIWERITENLIRKLENRARTRELLVADKQAKPAETVSAGLFEYLEV